MASQLGFPEQVREPLANPPLRAMLGQVLFRPVPNIANMGFIAPFQEAIGDLFPVFGQQQQVSLAVGPQGFVQQPPVQGWRSSSSDGSWSVSLKPDGVTLEASVAPYTSYELFREHFAVVWGAVVEHLKPKQRVQVGLRYINHIESKSGKATDWSQYVRTEILGTVASPILAPHISQAISEVRLDLDLGQLVFKHGVVLAGPQPSSGYLLDFDCFRQAADDDISVATALDQLDAFHAELYAFFRWCVTDKAMEGFRVRP